MKVTRRTMGGREIQRVSVLSAPVVMVPEEKDLWETYRNFPVYPGMHVWVKETARLLVWDGHGWLPVPRVSEGKKYRSRRLRLRVDSKGLYVRLGSRSRQFYWRR